MPRLSIDISAREHQELKAIAALKGLSIKDYVLSRTLATPADASELSDREALQALKALLVRRVAEVENGEVTALSAEDVGREARKRLKR